MFFCGSLFSIYFSLQSFQKLYVANLSILKKLSKKSVVRQVEKNREYISDEQPDEQPINKDCDVIKLYLLKFVTATILLLNST